MTLDQGKVGQVYTVTRVGGQGAARRRLLDFGVLPGTVVEIIRGGAFGGPGGASAAGVYLDPPAG